MTELLSVDGLACGYGERLLFESLSFAARAGEVVALRGANGSGKSTLLRTLAALRESTAGTVTIHGEVDYLGHADGLKPALTGRQHLAFWSELTGRPIGDEDPLSIRRTLDLPVRALSRGQQQRLALSRLFLSGRSIWLLDEPTGPFDSAGREAFDRMIGAHAARGGTAVVATHRTIAPPCPVVEIEL